MQEIAVIQQKLRELEIAAHAANVPMDTMLTLIERQFYFAAMERHRGNFRRVAQDIGRDLSQVYRRLKRMRQAKGV